MPFAYFLFGRTELAKCEFTVRQTVPEILLTINHLIFHTYFWKGRWGCVCLRISWGRDICCFPRGNWAVCKQPIAKRQTPLFLGVACLPHQRLVLITCFMRILALGSPAGIEGPAPFGSTSHRYVSEVRLCVCFWRTRTEQKGKRATTLAWPRLHRPPSPVTDRLGRPRLHWGAGPGCGEGVPPPRGGPRALPALTVGSFVRSPWQGWHLSSH